VSNVIKKRPGFQSKVQELKSRRYHEDCGLVWEIATGLRRLASNAWRRHRQDRASMFTEAQLMVLVASAFSVLTEKTSGIPHTELRELRANGEQLGDVVSRVPYQTLSTCIICLTTISEKELKILGFELTNGVGASVICPNCLPKVRKQVCQCGDCSCER
jgi:hypothetical protein